MADLTQKFVWKAKREKLKQQGIDPVRVEKAQARRRRVELRDEVGAVKARRDDREEEREQWQREQRRLQLERELGTLEEWQAQEERFHVEQARKRSELRLRAGRAKPIDRVYKTLSLHDELDFDVREPQHIFAYKSGEQIAEVLKDVDTYLEIDGEDPKHRRFWEALNVVGRDLLEESRRSQNERAVHQSVVNDVAAILGGKTVDELVALRAQIRDKLAEPDEAVDVEYWENLLARLQCVARAVCVGSRADASLLAE